VRWRQQRGSRSYLHVNARFEWLKNEAQQFQFETFMKLLWETVQASEPAIRDPVWKKLTLSFKMQDINVV